MSTLRKGLTSFKANSQINNFLRVKYIGNYLCDVAGATDVEVGVTTGDRTYTIVGDPAPVQLLNEPGSVWCTAAGAINDGDVVYRAAAGQVSDAGSDPFGVALEPATEAGDIIEVVPFARKLQGPSRIYTFTGVNGAGNIAIAGLAVGDVIDSIMGISTPGDAHASFSQGAGAAAAIIATAGELAQSAAGDLHLATYILVVHTP